VESECVPKYQKISVIFKDISSTKLSCREGLQRELHPPMFIFLLFQASLAESIDVQLPFDPVLVPRRFLITLEGKLGV